MATPDSENTRRTVRSGWRRRLKLLLYCLLPTVTVICVLESVVRVGGFDQPLAGSIFFGQPGTADPLHRTDSVLFYSLRPDTSTQWQGSLVTTNALGLRCAEIRPKADNEFRILSLGESSTFGARVEDHETYSARLEELLNARDDSRIYRVINAGVSGYTSFQSVKYLETRGLQLQPDLILFYHEQNDFLQARYSDRELYESGSHAWHRRLADYSAFYRVVSNALARRSIEAARLKSTETQNAAAEIVDQHPEPEGSLTDSEGRTRVSRGQRRDNFQQLAAIGKAHRIRLVIIHPCYANTELHRCELTEFCSDSGTAMYEAFDALHAEGIGQRELFADECHPNAKGHTALARGLYEFLSDQFMTEPLVPDKN